MPIASDRPVSRLAVSSPGEWEALMVSAQKGDPAAYERLLRAVTPLLRAIARRRLPDHLGAEDAVQDTLLTLHTLRHSYDPSRPLRPWVAALCERRCIDRLRWHRRHAAGEVPFTGPEQDFPAAGSEQNAEASLLRHQVQALVAALPRAQRIALELTKIQDLPLVEASARSGMAVGALKIAAFRGVRSLRRRLAVAEAA